MIGLEDRTCHPLMVAGVLGPDGGMPVCIGKNCSSFECCLRDLIEAKLALDDIESRPNYTRVIVENRKRARGNRR